MFVDIQSMTLEYRDVKPLLKGMYAYQCVALLFL